MNQCRLLYCLVCDNCLNVSFSRIFTSVGEERERKRAVFLLSITIVLMRFYMYMFV